MTFKSYSKYQGVPLHALLYVPLRPIAIAFLVVETSRWSDNIDICGILSVEFGHLVTSGKAAMFSYQFLSVGRRD